MSVLIKGLKIPMPERCWGCWFMDMQTGKCYADGNVRGLTKGYKRPADCPLMPIPDHGDLIDRDALVALWEKDIVGNKENGITDYTYTDMEEIYREFIYDAKMLHAVIPAERSKNEHTD